MMRTNNSLEPTRVTIIEDNIIYLTGLPLIFREFSEQLFEESFFGAFGKVQKITFGNNYNQKWDKISARNEASNSSNYVLDMFVSYSNELEAIMAILNMNNLKINDSVIRVQKAKNQFCRQFKKNLPCFNSNCQYVHSFENITIYDKENQKKIQMGTFYLI